MNDNEEIWKEIPQEVTNGISGYEASNKCRIRKDDNIIQPSKSSIGPKGGYYKSTNISGKTVYFHRMMFFAFNPNLVNTGGRIILKDITNPKINEDGMFDLSINDVLFQPFKVQINVHNEILPDGEYEHPVYGKYNVNGWFPVQCYVKNDLIKFDMYELQLTTNTELSCKIKSKYNNIILKFSYNADNMITLSKEKKQYKLMLTHIILSTVFPNIHRNETVDHIDHDHKNNSLNNLEWISQEENSKRNTKNQFGLHKDRNGRKITLKKEDFSKEFTSFGSAARYILEQKLSEGRSKTIESKLRNCIDKQNLTAYGFTIITTNNISIEDEIWKTIYDIEVSNKGRIRNRTGIITGTVIRGKKYKTVVITKDNSKKRYYIHHLVWIAFNGNIHKEKIWKFYTMIKHLLMKVCIEIGLLILNLEQDNKIC